VDNTSDRRRSNALFIPNARVINYHSQVSLVIIFTFTKAPTPLTINAKYSQTDVNRTKPPSCVGQDVHHTVIEHIETGGKVQYDKLLEVACDVSEWSIADCCTIIDTADKIHTAEIGDSTGQLDTLADETDTDVAYELQYWATVAVVETVLDQYDDPVMDYNVVL